MKFGELVRSQRKAAGLSKEALAEQAAMSTIYLHRIEVGKRPPPSERIISRLAHALHYDESKLLAIADASRPPRKPLSEATRQRMRKAHLKRKDSEATRAKKVKSLEIARQEKARLREIRMSAPQYTYTECGFCGIPGPVEEKTAIYYEDEQAGFDLCPKCFADWQAKPDDAVLDSDRQEKSA